MTHRQIQLVVFALMSCMFLSSLDQTVVSTAIRTIGDDLNGLDKQAWVTTAYLITSTIMTPIYGKLSDIFGRRGLFITSVSIFVLGSFASSFSTSMLMLAGFRAFQGIGAGGLMSLPLAIMGDIMPPRERAKYQGYFLAVFGVSTVVGPLVGGIFADAHEILWIAGWRWVFLINVPIGAFALFMLFTFLHLPRVTSHAHHPVDWWGATTVVVALVPLLLVAEQGRSWGWTSAGSIACYVTSAVGLVAFILAERVAGEYAIIPLKLFRSHGFSMASLLGLLVGFGMFGAMMTIPMYLQIVKGMSPTESGFATLPMVLGIMTASITVGLVIARTGRYGFFSRIGSGMTAVAFLLLIWSVGRPFWTTALAMFILGLGLGQLMQTLTQASQNAVAGRDIGVATSGATFFRQIGGTLGTAVLLSVLFQVMPTNIQKNMGDEAMLRTSLSAALDPSVASAPQNAGIMEKVWTPITSKIKANYTQQLAKATAAVDAQVQDAVEAKAKAAAASQAQALAKLPADQRQAALAAAQAKIKEATAQAQAQALAKVAQQQHVSVVNGKLTIDWSNASQRNHAVDQLAPKLAATIRSSSGSTTSSSSMSDTSFLNGADERLTQPFLDGFNSAARVIYWIGFGVIAFTFVLSWFFKVPPLRERSALEERAAEMEQGSGDDDRAPSEPSGSSLEAGVEDTTGTGSGPRRAAGPRRSQGSSGTAGEPGRPRHAALGSGPGLGVSGDPA